jgi:signal transduction histidine kinase
MPLGTHVYFGRKRLDDIKKAYEISLVDPSAANRQRFLSVVDFLSEQLTGIETAKNRIKGVVNTLLNLVRKRTDEKGEVQLELLVAGAIAEVRFQTYWETLAEPKIVREIPAGLPFILGITQDLQGVFVNLIINALHAMEKTADKQIAIKARVAEDYPDMIQIVFSDTGSGIPEEIRDRIFEHGFTTKKERGTGIGLFYCKDIIERVHGGKISVQSQVGRGTCFTIYLPIYKESNSPIGDLAHDSKRSNL